MKIVPGHECQAKCFGKFWPKDPEDFLNWELDQKNVALRPPGKGKHQSAPMAGRHVAYGGKHKDKRGSDRVERVYCAFEVLRMSPRFVRGHMSGKGGRTYAAERLVADRLGESLGRSGRGRPRTGGNLNFLGFEKTGTIYSLWRTFKARHPYPDHCPDPVVAQHLNLYWRVRNFEAAMKRAARQGDVSEARQLSICRRIINAAAQNRINIKLQSFTVL